MFAVQNVTVARAKEAQHLVTITNYRAGYVRKDRFKESNEDGPGALSRLSSMIQWPPHSKIICIDSNGDVIAKSKRSRLDLSDALMLNYWGDEPRQCTIEVSTEAENWKSWNSENVRKVEDHIRYDLEFDGYIVELYRVSRPGKTLCSKSFQWNIKITSDYGDDESENSSSRTSVGSRFKIARSDASVKAIQSQIEKVFGLPKGSVCLLTPENKKTLPRSSIKKLRSRWKNAKKS